MTYSGKKIAIIGGTGKEGQGLALRFAKAGYEVAIGSRNKEKAATVVEKLKEKLPDGKFLGAENKEAASEFPLVILTVPRQAHNETLRNIAQELKGKILIDATVSLDPENPKRILFPDGLAAALSAQKLISPNAAVVAAFQNISSLALQHFEHPLPSDILVCADNKEARETVFRLIHDIEGNPVNAGPLENSGILETLTALLIGINIRYKSRDAGIKITGI